MCNLLLYYITIVTIVFLMIYAFKKNLVYCCHTNETETRPTTHRTNNSITSNGQESLGLKSVLSRTGGVAVVLFDVTSQFRVEQRRHKEAPLP